MPAESEPEQAVDVEAAKKSAEAKSPAPAPPEPASEDVDEKEKKQTPDSSKKKEGKKEEKDFGGETWMAVMKKIMADMENATTKDDREYLKSVPGKIASGAKDFGSYVINKFSMSPSPDEKKLNADVLKEAEALNKTNEEPGAGMKEIEMTNRKNPSNQENTTTQTPSPRDP